MTDAIGLTKLFPATAASAAQSGGQDFFALAEARLQWLNGRQKLLANNIANADTPDFHARDLQPFDRMLVSSPVAPAVTDPAHIAPAPLLAAYTVRDTSDRSLDGNTVNVEGQLVKVADVETNAAMASNLWKATMGLFMTALGKGG